MAATVHNPMVGRRPVTARDRRHFGPCPGAYAGPTRGLDAQDAAVPRPRTPRPTSVALGGIVALGATAALRRATEVRHERAGHIDRLGPGAATDLPSGRFDARIADWIPARPHDRRTRTAAAAWAAPATVAGLRVGPPGARPGDLARRCRCVGRHRRPRALGHGAATRRHDGEHGRSDRPVHHRAPHPWPARPRSRARPTVRASGGRRVPALPVVLGSARVPHEPVGGGRTAGRRRAGGVATVCRPTTCLSRRRQQNTACNSTSPMMRIRIDESSATDPTRAGGTRRRNGNTIGSTRRRAMPEHRCQRRRWRGNPCRDDVHQHDQLVGQQQPADDAGHAR